MPESAEYLTTSQAARLIGIARSTLVRWADAGRIVYSVGDDGERRFRRADIESIVVRPQQLPDEPPGPVE